MNIFSILKNNLFFKTIPLEDNFNFDGQSYLSITYSPESKMNTLDLYIPKNIKNPKLIILIHGGAFLTNDSQSRQAKFMYRYFLQNGYACASINYRYLDNTFVYNCISDCKAAVRFLKANKDRYGYSIDDITLWGESAGAYLACMVAFSKEMDFSTTYYLGQNDHNISCSVSNVISYYGIMSFDNLKRDFKDSNIPYWTYKASQVFGFNFDSTLQKHIEKMNQEDINEYSVFTQIKNIENKMNVFIAHGDCDISVPYTHSFKLNRLLEKNQLINTHLETCHSYKHADDRFYSDNFLKNVLSFIRR